MESLEHFTPKKECTIAPQPRTKQITRARLQSHMNKYTLSSVIVMADVSRASQFAPSSSVGAEFLYVLYTQPSSRTF